MTIKFKYLGTEQLVTINNILYRIPYKIFDYPFIFDGTPGVKLVANTVTPLSSDDYIKISNVRSELDPLYLQRALGVDANGAYLGVITDISQATSIVPFGPPNEGGWIWDTLSYSWVQFYAVDTNGNYLGYGTVPLSNNVIKVPSAPPNAANGYHMVWSNNTWNQVVTPPRPAVNVTKLSSGITIVS